MSVGKILVLAGMVLTTVSAVAPAAALATWLKHHNAITQDEKLEFTGRAGFELAPLDSYDCDVHVSTTLKAGTTTGTVDTYEVTTDTCIGKGGFAKCTLLSDEALGLPWTMHVESTGGAGRDIAITDVTLKSTYGGAGCQVPSSNVHFPKVTAKPNNQATIGSVALSGGDTADVVRAYGTLQAVPANTFGLG